MLFRSEMRMAFIKRSNPTQREQTLLNTMPQVSPLIEKAAKAISDWHSEADWALHVDKAIRAIEAVAETLQREGHTDSYEYLSRSIWKEDPSDLEKDSEPKQTKRRYSTMYF